MAVMVHGVVPVPDQGDAAAPPAPQAAFSVCCYLEAKFAHEGGPAVLARFFASLTTARADESMDVFHACVHDARRGGCASKGKVR